MAGSDTLAQIENLMTYLCYARKPGSAFRGTLVLEFPQRNGPNVTMSVRVTDDYVCAFEGMPPDGKISCRAVIGLEDFIHIYSGTASASEIGQMVFGGRISVPGWKFRELASFATSFDFSYESWDNYYRLKPHADFGLSKTIAPTAIASTHAFVAATRLLDGTGVAQAAQPMTVPDRIIALLLEPRIVSEQLTLEAAGFLQEIRQEVLAICDETVDEVAAVAHQVYWDISRFKLLPKSCEDLVPPFVGVEVSPAVSPFHAHIAKAVDEVLAIRKRASHEIDELEIRAGAGGFLDEWVQKAQLIWDEDVNVRNIVPFLEGIRTLAVARVTSGLKVQVASMEAAVQDIDYLRMLSLGSRADVEAAHKALRPMLAYFTSTPSQWMKRAIAEDQTRPVLPAFHFAAVEAPQHSRRLMASLGWLIERPGAGRADSDFSDWWNARPQF